MKLTEYRSKRDFKKTPEPSGREGAAAGEPLHFVVHKHHATRLHWDLRLELDGVLKSWAVPKGPSLDPDDKKLAVMVEDHPIDYQFFEGVIPEGNYGAGVVMIWDRGMYYAVGAPDRGSSEEILRAGLAKGHISFVLDGQRLKGEFALVRLKKAQENSWLLLKKNDAESKRGGGLVRTETSVASGRTMDEIGAGKPDLSSVDLSGAPSAAMPLHVKPMLATPVEAPFDRPGWLFEIKWDGYRALGEVSQGKARLYSRNDKTLNERFPAIAQSLATLPFDALFDGEVVVVDGSGRADFQLLQDYLQSARGTLAYYVFDLLYFEGFDLRTLPLVRRKGILRQILPTLPYVAFSEHVEKEGSALFEAARENDVEGVMAKDAMSPYRSGERGREWLKIKTHRQQEAVIGGFTRPKGGRKGFGALILGVYEAGRLVYIGHTGGGFTDEQLASVLMRLEPLAREGSPFDKAPKTNTDVTWVEPALVCEVRFSEWTNEGFMRQPVFLGMREDIDPRDVRREEAEKAPRTLSEKRDVSAPAALARAASRAGRSGSVAVINDAKVEVTNPEKVFWPEEGYTKGDVIDYYRGIAPFILPYLKDRPESLHRHPDGISGEAFFQKNIEHQVPDWVKTVSIRSDSENRDTRYLLCQDEASLVYMANLGCIEINPWHARIGSLDSPDFMVLDLDPLDAPFKDVVETAVVTHEVLLEIGARGSCKTSGGRGLHIYVPLGGAYSWEQSTQFARLVNLAVHARLPRITSIERKPEKRPGKVYLDYLQNRHGQTLVAPYSLRPRKGAPVSTPLEWEEVKDGLDRLSFTMRTMPERARKKGDLWKDVLGPGIDMAQCLARLEGTFKG
jgi:bifunctional non-homologous end joining protein LigD